MSPIFSCQTIWTKNRIKNFKSIEGSGCFWRFHYRLGKKSFNSLLAVDAEASWSEVSKV